MKFLILILMMSCGKNAFLKSDTRLLPGLGGDENGYRVEFSPSSLDFDYMEIGEEKRKTFKIRNIGQRDIFSINNLVINENYTANLESCSEGLSIDEECEVNVTFKSVNDFVGEVKVDLALGFDEVGFLNYPLNGSILNLSEDDGGLDVFYLKNKKINFKTTLLGSTYQKLIFVEGKNIKVDSLYPRTHENLKLSYYDAQGGCNQDINKGCFFNLTFRPTKIGRFKDQVLISYIGEDNKKYVLKVDIRANVIEHDKCFNFSEKASLAKQEFDQYELSLAYPYYAKADNSHRELTSTLNTLFTDTIDYYDMALEFNKDAQVFFSFNLPSENIISSRLLLDLLKYEDIKNDSYDTEVLCNLDTQKCSGKRFTESSYKKLINKNFKIINGKFARDIVFSGGTRIDDKFFRFRSSFELSRYLNLTQKSLNKFDNQTMSFVIADDTKLEKEAILVSSVVEEFECEESIRK